MKNTTPTCSVFDFLPYAEYTAKSRSSAWESNSILFIENNKYFALHCKRAERELREEIIKSFIIIYQVKPPTDAQCRFYALPHYISLRINYSARNIRRLQRFVWFALLRLQWEIMAASCIVHTYRWTTRRAPRRLTSRSLALCASQEKVNARTCSLARLLQQTHNFWVLTSISLILLLRSLSNKLKWAAHVQRCCRFGFIHGWHFSVSEKPI